MKSYFGLSQVRNWLAGLAAKGRNCSMAGAPVAACVALLVLFLAPQFASSQAAPSGYRQSLSYFAGATATGQYLQYGERKQLGVTGFLDVETSHHIGAEVEVTWIKPRQVDNLHTMTYQAGPRFRIDRGKWEPYVKTLVGVGEFSYPYHYFGTGSFLIVSPGGGVDYRLNSRVRVRLADFEYTYWPQFTYNPGTTTPISSGTLSSGIRVRIF